MRCIKNRIKIGIILVDIHARHESKIKMHISLRIRYIDGWRRDAHCSLNCWNHFNYATEKDLTVFIGARARLIAQRQSRNCRNTHFSARIYCNGKAWRDNEFKWKPTKHPKNRRKRSKKILLSRIVSQSVGRMRLVTIIQHKIKWHKNRAARRFVSRCDAHLTEHYRACIKHGMIMVLSARKPHEQSQHTYSKITKGKTMHKMISWW